MDMYTHYEKLGANDVNKELVDTLLEEAAKLSSSVLFPCYLSGDDEPCKLTGESVSTPKAFKEAYKQMSEGGWIGISNPTEFGGQGLPSSVGVAAREMMATANWPFIMYPGLSAGCVQTLLTWGSDAQKKEYLPKLVEGTWSGTMCLTEPHCGTDLGQIKTKAKDNGDGTYNLSGTKIFISAGDHDLTENIIHIVLAKLPGAPEGTKGISLFLVPRHVKKADGSLESKKNVLCTGLEVKMGIKASATCQMTFDNSVGYLIGKENEGMKEMFTFMNTARMGTALQGVAHSELAYQNALEYAQERTSMRTVSGAKNPEKTADFIIDHAAVRHNILFAKSIAEGGRCFLTDMARIQDKIERATDAKVAKKLDSELGFLTPIAKAFLTELGTEASLLSQTVYGGHGYIKGNGMEQIVRDCRISTLYEGTTIIQSLDLIARKVLLSKVDEAGAFGSKVNTLAKSNLFGSGAIGTMSRSLWMTQKAWRVLITRLKVSALKDKETVSASAVDFLMATGYMVVAYYWLRMAVAAKKKIDAGADTDGFYQAKIDTATFYFERVLPRFSAHASTATSSASVLSKVHPATLQLLEE
eukprot:TRINITY_DN8112_c0_g1_i2.p1 TRINITY_DN8112_c0_g1~~TRINITY_DN8112_c0_g1_i2.p1  ORF type:complete len:585 (+),score=245.41 TRINITY_DN8112_c0_g1_i2:250-2004(+)